MIDEFVRELRLLQKADTVIMRIWFKLVLRRFSLFALASLVAVFGLAMTNVAGLYALQASVGPVWAAVLMAVGDFVIAAIIMLLGANLQPGSEIESAFDIRKMALESMESEAHDLKAAIDGFGQQIQEIKDTIAGVANNPLDAAVQTFLIPAATSLLRGLRSKKDQA